MTPNDSERLKKCLLMLSSQHDGEVVNAARMITRVLSITGHDWHWLADKLNGGGTDNAGWAAAIQTAYEKGLEKGRQEAQAAPPPPPPPVGDHQTAARWIQDNFDAQLRVRDRDFLDSMARWNGQPTERQAAWLADLCHKFGYQT